MHIPGAPVGPCGPGFPGRPLIPGSPGLPNPCDRNKIRTKKYKANMRINISIFGQQLGKLSDLETQPKFMIFKEVRNIAVYLCLFYIGKKRWRTLVLKCNKNNYD
jgi:hypothetical protein